MQSSKLWLAASGIGPGAGEYADPSLGQVRGDWLVPSLFIEVPHNPI